MHYNSAIWNNALWSIRTRLAQIDDQDGNTSKLAHEFDRAVYGALATRLTPTSSFVDARAAVEQVIIDSQLRRWCCAPPARSSTRSKICTGCPTTSELAGDAVTTASQTQLHPSISGNRVLWLDLSSTTDYAGYAAATTLGGSGTVALGLGGRARGRLRRRRGHVARHPRPGHPHGDVGRLGQHGDRQRPPGGHPRCRLLRLRHRRGLALRQRCEVRRRDRHDLPDRAHRASRATPSPRSPQAAAPSRSAPTRAGSSSGARAAATPARSASCPARSSPRRRTAGRSSRSTTATGRCCSPRTARPSR